MLRLICPKCGKLLGYARDPLVARSLLLWCRRCKAEVVPESDTIGRDEPTAEPS